MKQARKRPLTSGFAAQLYAAKPRPKFLVVVRWDCEEGRKYQVTAMLRKMFHFDEAADGQEFRFWTGKEGDQFSRAVSILEPTSNITKLVLKKEKPTGDNNAQR